MAEVHVDVLERGSEAWNTWRLDNPRLRPVLRGADLRGLDLGGYDFAFINGIGGGVDFAGADLTKANLAGCSCTCADFTGATVREADLSHADLGGTDFSGADLTSSDLSGTSPGDLFNANFRHAKLIGVRAASVDCSYADFTRADLTDARFTHVDLQHARFNEAVVEGATFSDCRVYGTAAWSMRGSPAVQERLMVTPINADLRPPTGIDMRYREAQYDAALTVDRIELAPLVFAVLNRDRFAEVISTFTSKVVLILGRFTEPRMAVLQAVREKLAGKRYLPVVFDFASPWRRDLTETISTLAHLSRFVVADLTDAKSIPQELGRIVPFLPSVPVVPLLGGEDEEPYAMFEHFARYPWVQPLLKYATVEDLLARIGPGVIDPAEAFLQNNQ